MSEISLFLKSKFKRDYNTGVDIYSRCKGCNSNYLPDLKRGYTKKRWDFLKLQLKNLQDKRIVPSPKPKLIKAQVQAKVVSAAVEKIQQPDRKQIATKTELEKKKLQSDSSVSLKKKRENPGRSILDFISNYLTQMKAPNWLKSITEYLKSGKWKSTPGGKLLMNITIKGLFQKHSKDLPSKS